MRKPSKPVRQRWRKKKYNNEDKVFRNTSSMGFSKTFLTRKGFEMKERLFIQKAKEQVRLEEFVRKQFAQAK